jgi:hypothetical protein
MDENRRKPAHALFVGLLLVLIMLSVYLARLWLERNTLQRAPGEANR